MLLTILGSCANQISNREGVSLLIENRKDNILIDCGPGIVAAFGRCYRRTSTVNNLILTHVHGDHIAGFPYFVWNRNFECMGKNPPDDLHVYGEKETILLANYMLKHCYPELDFPFEIIYHEIRSKESFNCGKIKINVIRAIHAVDCISCVVMSEGKKIVYSSDTIYNNELINYSENSDILVHEGMMLKSMNDLAKKVKHSTAFSAGEFAKNTNAKQLLLVHIAPSLLGRENELLEEASFNYNGNISIPHDGSVYWI